MCCVARARTRLALSVCRASPATACYIVLLRTMRLRGSSPESRPAGHDRVVCEPYPIRTTDHIVVVVRHIQMRERTDLRASCLSPTAPWFHPRGRAGLRRTRAPLGQPCVVQFSSFTPHAMEPILAGRPSHLSARREYRGRPTLGAPRTLPTHTPASKPFRASASPFPPAVANRLLLRPRRRRVVSPMAFKSASFNRIFQGLSKVDIEAMN